MLILGIDPGEESGYALIDVRGETIRVHDYGSVPVTEPGLVGLTVSTWRWIEAYTPHEPEIDQVAFEEWIPSYRMRTSKESTEVRAAIRLWCALHRAAETWWPMTPQAVRSRLSCRDKRDVRTFVERAIGMKPKGPDHVADAFGVALACGLMLGVWTPRIDLTRQVSQPKRPRLQKPEPDLDMMTTDDLRDAINRGKIRVGRR